MRATVLTTWIGSGTMDDPYRPAIVDDHRLLGFTDLTGQAGETLRPLLPVVIDASADEDVMSELHGSEKCRVIAVDNKKEIQDFLAANGTFKTQMDRLESATTSADLISELISLLRRSDEERQRA